MQSTAAEITTVLCYPAVLTISKHKEYHLLKLKTMISKITSFCQILINLLVTTIIIIINIFKVA